MRFGLWYDLRNPPQWHEPYAELYDRALDEIGWADDAGFHSIYVSEHHITDDGYLPSVFPFLAAVATQTRRVRIGTAILLAPFHHPIRFAEDAAFVDQLSRGRLELGLGLAYRRDEFRALDVPRPERAFRTIELIEISRLAWTGEPFSYEGTHFRFRDVIVTPPAYQEAGPPLWLGGATAKAAARAGSHGCHWMPDVIAAGEHYETYVAALAAAGHDPGEFRVAGNPTIYVTDNPERGRQELEPHLLYQLGLYSEWFAAGGPKLAAPVDLDHEIERGRIVIGTPEQVIERIEALRARCPFDELYFWARLPGLAPELSKRSLELFATHVLPHFDVTGSAP
jgi:alkanesulfonate monooxygenase SsuD/methylene tetrahydromethanopterin reductase-like flavin-dependent oxidoreductase (luciferase family)